jgi:hypothetical protein
MNYAQQLDLLCAVDHFLGEQVRPLRNLEAILKWAPGAGIPFAGIDLVQQDEYSYDLYLPLPDARWLVFGVS